MGTPRIDSVKRSQPSVVEVENSGVKQCSKYFTGDEFGNFSS